MSQMIMTAIRTSTQLGIEVPPIDVVRVNHSMTFLPKRGAIGDPSPDFSHQIGASGLRISESCCAATTFERLEKEPRCRQSVAQNASTLELLKGGLWKPRLMPAW